MPRTTGGRPAFIEAKGDILVGKKEKAFYRLIAEAALAGLYLKMPSCITFESKSNNCAPVVGPAYHNLIRARSARRSRMPPLVQGFAHPSQGGWFPGCKPPLALASCSVAHAP
jgi:hypothetical protein